MKPNGFSFSRLLKKYWPQCVFVLVILYLLLEIHRAYEMHDAIKRDYDSLLLNPDETTNAGQLDYSRTPYFDRRNHSSEKIDWHDYKLIEYEAKRTGNGEQGKGTVLTKVDEVLNKAMYHANGYNAYISDQISLNRSVADTRHPNCKTKTYLADLPTVSAIVPFWNEQFSTVLRTAQSMLNRAPPHILLEVILVNDFSDIGFQWNELNSHVMEHYGDRVKVIHLKERKGLMAARTIGASAAKGDVLVFADAHTEANVNWLPPLLEPIALNYRTVTVPYVDAIDVAGFAYRQIPHDVHGHRGTFNWKFLYFQVPRKPEDIKDPIEPFQSPVMNGGLFAISAKWFWELGGYDDGLDIWGGEQFEISFKLWQCGGEMLDIPCSRFGHVFRTGGKDSFNPRNYEYLYTNYKRVAEVWMDEYAQYVYMRDPELYAKIDAGDLTKMKAIRTRLKCKSFQWYLDNVATEVLEKYLPVVPIFAWGAIRSMADSKLCVDTMNGILNDRQVALQPCASPNEHQNFNHTHYRDIQYKQELCFESDASENRTVVLRGCLLNQGGQFWRYDHVKKMIYKNKAGTYCLDCDTKTNYIFVNKCDETRPTQKWEWGAFNETMMANWEANGAKLL